MTRLWGGRFSKDPAEQVIAFTSSIGFDVRLVHLDCAVLAAHGRALARAGVMEDDEASRAADALKDIAEDIASGAFAVSPADEDIHSAVERALLDRLPDVAPKIRAGLSRNDRIAAAFRLWVIDAAADITTRIGGLIETLRSAAARHPEAVLPGYTHLQRAQPVRLADHLDAHADALSRDADRMADAGDRADASPLGAGALAGTTLPIDRDATAQDLGFAGVIWNTLDAVSARDFAAEFLAAAAITGVHLSRLAEEIVLWTTSEFGFAELDDSFATGSSLMPHKKNPDVAELVRGKSGRLIGNLTGLLATMKGLPLAYNRDLQEDKEPVFDTADMLAGMLSALDGLVGTMRFNIERMAEAASDWTMRATALAEELVRRGVPFRDAHEVVGKLVSNGGEPASAGKKVLTALHPELPGAVKAIFG
ncbi:MAG: argininosuccinate lyase [Actinomycetota bacterium]